MQKKIHYFTCAGKGTSLCKDTVYFRENGEHGFYSLADGLNSRKKSHIGAKIFQKAIADFWEERPESFFQKPLNVIKAEVIEIEKKVLYNLSQQGFNVEDYESTMMILLISEKHKRFKWMHIGDGLILKERSSGEMEIVSYPQNGITSQFTFTTTSKPHERYLRMGEGNLEDIKRFMLFTDGAIAPFYKERKLTETGEDFLKRGTDVFRKVLDQLKLQDDYSMLEVRLADDL